MLNLLHSLPSTLNLFLVKANKKMEWQGPFMLYLLQKISTYQGDLLQISCRLNWKDMAYFGPLQPTNVKEV